MEGFTWVLRGDDVLNQEGNVDPDETLAGLAHPFLLIDVTKRLRETHYLSHCFVLSEVVLYPPDKLLAHATDAAFVWDSSWWSGVG